METHCIAQALIDAHCVGYAGENPITFKSGILSPVYVDNRKLLFHPSAWNAIIEGMATRIRERDLQFDVIGGVETAGIPHAAALAFHLKQPCVYVRKQAKAHGTQSRVEGGDVAGKRVLLVEDMITTGGSSLSAVAGLRESGAVVNDCMAIISYGFSEAVNAFATAQVTLHTLTDFAAVLEVGGSDTAPLFSADAQATVRDWLRDPWAWSGHEG
jgi:orotate phosphoribosyltransferase